MPSILGALKKTVKDEKEISKRSRSRSRGRGKNQNQIKKEMEQISTDPEDEEEYLQRPQVPPKRTTMIKIENANADAPGLNSTGPKTGSGGLVNQTITNDDTIRSKAFGHFMNNVTRFINRDIRDIGISKGELFQPEPSKRTAENIDPLSEQIDIVPYWQTNGLENIGVLPPTMTTINGTFNKPITTNPQKFVFMTYQSGINKFYNCKLPMKVNIPSGDFGIYKITVNEVLFRTDMDLINENDYITFSFDLDNFEIIDKEYDDKDNEISSTSTSAGLKGKIIIPLKTSLIFKEYTNIHMNNLDIDRLITFLNQLLVCTRITITVKNPYNPSQDEIIPIDDVFHITKDLSSGLGIIFYLGQTIIAENTSTKHKAFLSGKKTIFTLNECSSNFRHIFPPLQTTTTLTSQTQVFYSPSKRTFEYQNSIYIPRCNFAGPQLILFNSSAQTTCPISNEYAKQFNTCALSYNTNEDTNSLIQMTSNVELTMKNTNEFRVWLTDNYGEPIKIQSPIYVQVTVQPFVNETSTAMNE